VLTERLYNLFIGYPLLVYLT